MSVELLLDRERTTVTNSPDHEAEGEVVRYTPVAARILIKAGIRIDLPLTDLQLAQEMRNRMGSASVPGRAVLQLMIEIAEGSRSRPRAHGKTTLSLLASEAGVSVGTMYRDADLRHVTDAFVNRLPGPGVNVRVRRGQMEQTPSAMDRIHDWLVVMRTTGQPLPRRSENVSVPSHIGCAEMIGLTYQQLPKDGRRLIDAMVPILGLGAIREEVVSRADRAAALADVLDVVAGYVSRNEPLPEQKRFRGRVAHDRVFEKAGCVIDFRTDRAYEKAIQQAELKVGVAPEGTRLDGIASFASIKQYARGDFSRRGIAASWANMSSFINKVRTVFDAAEGDPLPDCLYGTIDTFLDEMDSRGKSGQTDGTARNLRWCGTHLHRIAQAYAQGGGLPFEGHLALGLLVRASGLTLEEIGQRSGIGKFTLGEMIEYDRPIPAHAVKLLPRLEEVLSATEGSLGERFTSMDRSFQGGQVGSDLYRNLSCQIRRLLPDGADLLPDAELQMLASEIVNKVLVQDVPYSHMLRSGASRSFAALPEDAPLHAEIDELVHHKMDLISEEVRRTKFTWGDESAQMNRDRLREWGEWLAAPRAEGGLGIDGNKVSLVYFLNWRVTLRYLDYLSGRFANADITTAGRTKKRGSVLTEWDLYIVHLTRSLVHSKYGWITQRLDSFGKHVVVDDTPLPPLLHIGKLLLDRFKASHHSASSISAGEDRPINRFLLGTIGHVMPKEIANRALDADQWTLGCVEVHDHYDMLIQTLSQVVSRSRDPMIPIHPMVRSKEPLAWFFEGIQAAMSKLPGKSKPYQHAAAVRDVVIMLLLSTTALRSKNIRQLTFDPAGDGHIQFEDDRQSDEAGGATVVITIPWEDFKNRNSNRLFGPLGNKRDYCRKLGEWSKLPEILQYYIDECLPILRYGGKSTLLFPKKGSTELGNEIKRAELQQQLELGIGGDLPIETLNAIYTISEGHLSSTVRRWTGRYVVIDPKTQRVRPGMARFGPHAVRDLVATDIVLSSDSELRWEIAADLLQTSVAQVLYRYAFARTDERASRADPILQKRTSVYDFAEAIRGDGRSSSRRSASLPRCDLNDFAC